MGKFESKLNKNIIIKILKVDAYALLRMSSKLNQFII